MRSKTLFASGQRSVTLIGCGLLALLVSGCGRSKVPSNMPAPAAPLAPAATQNNGLADIHTSDAELASVATDSIGEPNDGSIDPHSGRLYLSTNDLIVPAGAVELVVQRHFQPRPSSVPGLLGKRWRLNWECTLFRSGPLAVIEEGVGTIVFSLDKAGGTYRSPSGDELIVTDQGAVRTKTDGKREMFDAQGRLAERDERNGNRIRFQYDADNRLSKVEGPFNNFLRFVTSPEGRLVRVEGSTGRSVSYSYGTDARPEGGEFVVSYGYGPADSLVRVVQPQAGQTEFSYDPQGRVTGRKWADGAAERYEYNDAARTVRQIDPAGRVTATEWSADDRKTTTIDALGHKTVVERNAAGQTTKIVGPTGQVLQFSYDPLGRVALDGEKQSFEYDGQQNLQKIRRHDCDSIRTLETPCHPSVAYSLEPVAALPVATRRATRILLSLLPGAI